MSPKYAALFSLSGTRHGAYLLRRSLYIERELPRFLDQDVVAEGMRELSLDESLAASCGGIRSDHAAIAAMELSWYMRNQLLRDTDWASMAHGVEVRTPFIDTRFIDALLPALTSSKPPDKRVLANSAGSILLREIVERPKTGFITPVAGWVEAKYGSKGRGLRGWARMTYSRFVRETSVSRPDAILPRPSDAPPVLVFRIGQLGDAAVSLPALAALRRQRPDAPLVLLANEGLKSVSSVSAWDVIGPADGCDAAIFYDASRQGLANWYVLLKLAKSIRRLAPREVVNLAPRNRPLDVLRDRYYFKLVCGVPQYRAPPVDRSSASSKAEPEWLRLLKFITPSAATPRFRLPIPKWAANNAEAELAPLHRRERLIAFAPGSQMPAKRWPVNRYIDVGAQILARDSAVAIVIVGGKEDYPVGEQLREAWGARSRNLCGRLCVFGSAAVLNRCDAFVGNDSGAMHLAGLVGTPCVALFSARDADGKWQPFGEGHRVLRKEVPCRGCMLTVCDKDNLCLSKITVDEVVTAVEEVAAYQVH
jgi:ADP-heptose:LPS heptosyltransferase